MEGTIWDLKANPWSDSPRFYPPGQHPAIWRQREQLRKLKELPVRTPDVRNAIEYIEHLIAQFEQAESEAKARCHYAYDFS